MKSSEIIKLLRKGGFKYFRQAKGSHEVWQHPETGIQIIVPNHGAKEVGKGLAEKILKDAGLK